MKDVLLKKGLLLSFLAVLAIAGCSKMDDTYKEFIKDGQINYVGKASPAFVMPGRERLVLAWPVPSDPKAIKAKIYWNNRADSIEVPIERNNGGDGLVRVSFDDLAEGPYVFEIITFDNKGNSSVKVEARGRVYGSEYEARLLSRPIDKAEMYEDTLKIEWGAAPDTTVIGSELIYKDSNNNPDTIFVPAKTLLTSILDFVPQTFKHRTLYRPSRLAVDTFYTAYSSLKIKGPPVELSKDGWTATASSFDSRSGSRYRPASNAIDGNSSTIWVNQIDPQEVYPHTITVDMGAVQEDIEGFAVITREKDAAARPKTAELLTSLDNITWTSHGEIVFADSGDKQLFPLPAPVNARYFRIIAKDAHRSDEKNIAMAEVGVYTR